MTQAVDHRVVGFFQYPPIGGPDWRYTYAAARVRTLETEMLGLATLVDMANAGGFDEAADLLNGTAYALGSGQRTLATMEEVLLQRRHDVRQLFDDLVVEEPIAELFKARVDLANARLAIRRTVTDRPIGDDYSDQGNVDPAEFEQVFEQESYGVFPDYLQEAVESGVLEYYDNKDIKKIDHGVNQVEAQYSIATAQALGNQFLEGLFRLRVDLNNLRTMLRLKFLESEQRDVFLEGGYIESDRFRHGVEVDYETIASLFLSTAYHKIIEDGVSYLQSEGSFLVLESRCEEYLEGYLDSTMAISAGVQPLVAYLLKVEDEVRKVRLVLTAKMNDLDKQLILARLGHKR